LAFLEPFNAGDLLLLSSTGQASEQEKQRAHHKFTFCAEKKTLPSDYFVL